MSLNRVLLQGRLGADPELRTTTSGTEVATVNIAVDRDRKDADGNRQSDWVTIVAWKHTAKFLAQYFQKGRVIIVDGRLQMRNWTDKEGNKRTSAEVVADNIYFGDNLALVFGGRGFGGGDGGGGGNGGGEYCCGVATQAGLAAGFNNSAVLGNLNDKQDPINGLVKNMGGTSYGTPPADNFAELSDNDGELPF